MRLKVLLPLPLDGPYDYLLPADLVCAPGDFVRVPLGRREVIGVVWPASEPSATAPGMDPARLKPLSARLDAPPLPPVLLTFVDWVASYTLTPPGAVLALVMRARGALEPPRRRTAYLAGAAPPARLTPARRRVLEVLQDGLPRTAAELAHEAGTGAGVIKGLAAAGTLIAVSRPVDLPFPVPEGDFNPPTLSRHQADAAAVLKQALEQARFHVAVLDGVTGAGKTETYFEAIAGALQAGRQSLILLPEIALTLQFLERFTARFGCPPATWHSGMSAGARRRTWRAVAEGRARVVVGARSALFLPFNALGLIIVDEEHDPAFKQEEGVIYHARDMAVVRASLGKFPIILSSATPSLETLVNIRQGRYRRLELPRRHGGAALPKIDAVDMRRDKPEPGCWLSPPLVAALQANFAAGEQALLFLNRRGYAPLTLCRQCGHRMKSPDSSSWLVEHRALNRLVCHHSGFSMAKPKVCPACGAADSLVGCGPGVERVAEEAARLFPDVEIAVMSSDTVHNPAHAQDILERMTKGRIDLLIGTQMIAKGHHFPGLTLVGVVDADLGLGGGDLRAAERTFQLLVQVAGRAGRERRAGRVLLQSYMPDHEVMDALVKGDRQAFIQAETQERAALGLPPFGRLAALILSAKQESAVTATARALARTAPAAPGITVLGPAPAPFALLRGRHRQRFLIKAARDRNLQAYLTAWLNAVKIPSNVRLQVDIDPYSFL